MTNDVVVSANGSEINSCNHLKKIIYNSYTLNLGIWSNGDKFSIDDFQLNN